MSSFLNTQKLFFLILISLSFIPAYADVQFSNVDVCGLGIETGVFPFYLVCSSFVPPSTGSDSSVGTPNLNPPFEPDTLEIKVTPVPISADLGQTVNGIIHVEWNSGEDLQLNLVEFDEKISGDIDFDFNDPIIFTGDTDDKSTADIMYTMQIPPNYCSNEITFDCVQKTTYNIPLELQFVHDNKVYFDNEILPVNLSGEAFPLDFGQLLMFAGIGALIILAVASRERKEKSLKESHENRQTKHFDQSKAKGDKFFTKKKRIEQTITIGGKSHFNENQAKGNRWFTRKKNIQKSLLKDKKSHFDQNKANGTQSFTSKKEFEKTFSKKGNSYFDNDKSKGNQYFISKKELQKALKKSKKPHAQH